MVRSCKNHLIWAIVVPVPRALIYLASSGTSFTQEGGKVGRDDRTEDYGYGQDEGLL